MITIWKTPIVATVEQVLKDLKLQLYGAGLLKEIKNTGSDLMCTCPFHANGKEHKNMCKISEQNKETAKYYGYEAQSNQLVEECAELIQAVNKYRRVETGLGQPVAEDKKAIARDNLVEEIADVELMLEQVKYLLQIPEDELLAVKTFKVNRTRERMESSK